MLFDLRGRGRRRTVQVLYLGLALLMGSGLVFLGVGGGLGSTGILNSLTGNEGSSAASFSKEIKKYQKLTRTQPTNAEAWEKLTAAQLHEAGGESYVVNGAPTSKGKELFAQTAHSWEHYLSLNPPHPSLELAKEMLRIFGEEGLNEPSAAVAALQIVVAAEPTNASYFAALAQYAYKAKNVREGDLASAQAVSLAPAAQRARVKSELEAVKKNPSGSETLTGTTNGQTYTVKPSGSGSYTGTVPTKTTTSTPTAPTKNK